MEARKAYSPPVLEVLDIRATQQIDIGIGIIIDIGLFS